MAAWTARPRPPRPLRRRSARATGQRLTASAPQSSGESVKASASPSRGRRSSSPRPGRFVRSPCRRRRNQTASTPAMCSRTPPSVTWTPTVAVGPLRRARRTSNQSRALVVEESEQSRSLISRQRRLRAPLLVFAAMSATTGGRTPVHQGKPPRVASRYSAPDVRPGASPPPSPTIMPSLTSNPLPLFLLLPPLPLLLFSPLPSPPLLPPPPPPPPPDQILWHRAGDWSHT